MNLKKIFSLIVLVSLLFSYSCRQNLTDTRERSDMLWYESPAESWMEALPLGNGRIGVMVFGDTLTERIQLNDDSLWPGEEEWPNPPGTPTDLNILRKVLMDGDYSRADKLFVEKFSNLGVGRSHQTLGDLHIELNHSDISEYRRELDLSKGTATISYKTNGHSFSEKIFVSHPDQIIAMELESGSPEGINGTIRLSRPEDMGEPTVQIKSPDKNTLWMTGEVTQRGGGFRSQPAPINHGIKFRTHLKLINEGGEVKSEEGELYVRGCRKITLYLASNSSWYTKGYKEAGMEQLEKVEGSSFNDLLNFHANDHNELYSRVKLNLGGVSNDSLPTGERLEYYKAGNEDNGLEELMYNFGRYLLIASSRPGTNPANLQGLWNRHISAPWNADYHLNINLQMNYWLANMTNLQELNEPLYRYIDRMIESGKSTAKQNFGCRGSFIPHATDLWVPSWLRAATAYWGCSVGAGGWIMQHYWNGFEFSGDTLFLEEKVYPALHQVALFYSDWIIEDPRDGTLVSAPSTSPENQFILPSGDTAATCMGSAMDQQIIAEVFDHYLQASDILQKKSGFIDRVKSQRDKLRDGFVLGSDGRILEWDREYEELEPGHRHMSHLYGFHPGDAISSDDNPELFKAVRRTLDYRLDNGGAGTGWSRAWLINLSARLLDGEMAHEHIRLLLERSVAKNLFDMHPPFQIDGNFGYTSGMTEMLLQSHEQGIIRLLPALPENWNTGSVKGLRARGDTEVSLQWKDGQLEKAVFSSSFGRKIKVYYPGGAQIIELVPGKKFELIPATTAQM